MTPMSHFISLLRLATTSLKSRETGPSIRTPKFLAFLTLSNTPAEIEKVLLGRVPVATQAPAELGAAFDQADAGAQFGGLDRGRDPGFAAADDGRVESQGFHELILPESRTGTRAEDSTPRPVRIVRT